MYTSNEIDFSNVKTSCFLKDAQIYMLDGSRYLQLVYQYEDEVGIHELIIPQVEFPFGNPRIKGYLLLPAAYRSLSRPSSPP